MLFEQPRESPTLSTAPASDAAPFDYPGVPMADVPVADPNEPLARVIGAAHTAAQYDGISAGRINAVTDAYDARNTAIAQATGIKLMNPLRDGYYDEAFQRWRDENQYVPPHPPDMSDVQAQKSRLIEIQHGIWQEKLSQAAAANPLYADVIGADRPITQDAIGLANKAQSDLAAAQEAYGAGVPSFLASLAGGLTGSMRDPVNVAALAFGGGELKAASVAGQVFEGAIRQGLVNAGVQLMAEPQVQAWRAERGAEHGFIPAAEDVGLTALFGAIPGAGFAGVRALRRGGRSPQAISRDIGQAAAGDVEAAARVAAHLPAEIAPDLHAAIDSARLDREAMPALPEGLAAEDAADAMRGALRHAEDPGAPLAEQPGLHAESPEASLSPDALDMLLDGRADPATAQAVAMRLSDRTEQASVLAEAMRQRPQSPQEAAAAVSEIMERRAVPEAQAAALGVEAEPLPEVPAANVSRETNAERTAQVAELESAFDVTPPSPGADGDVFGLVPIGEREDGLGMRLVTRDELLAETPREHALADLVEACKT